MTRSSSCSVRAANHHHRCELEVDGIQKDLSNLCIHNYSHHHAMGVRRTKRLRTKSAIPESLYPMLSTTLLSVDRNAHVAPSSVREQSSVNVIPSVKVQKRPSQSSLPHSFRLSTMIYEPNEKLMYEQNEKSVENQTPRFPFPVNEVSLEDVETSSEISSISDPLALTHVSYVQMESTISKSSLSSITRPNPAQDDGSRCSNNHGNSGNSGATSAGSRVEIEVFPGLVLPLRGSFETIKALYKGRVIQTQCMECTRNLGCIDDAEFVLCPTCTCISLVGPYDCHRAGAFGIGLGFSPCNDVPSRFVHGASYIM